MKEVLISKERDDGPQYFNFSEFLYSVMYAGVHYSQYM